MRELVRAISELEEQLINRHGLSLNEAMVVCCLGEERLTASKVSENIGLTPSNTSKVLRSVESKGLLERMMGETDRRQMSFMLTQKGMEYLQKLKTEELEIPEFVRPLF